MIVADVVQQLSRMDPCAELRDLGREESGMNTTEAGYVRTNNGIWLVQLPDDNRWGFTLSDSDEEGNSDSWDGGFGSPAEGKSWELVPADKVPAEVKERLGWMLDE